MVAAELQREAILNCFLDGSCVDLDVGWPRFERKLDAKDVGLDPKDVPGFAKLGHKRLISKQALGCFQSIEGSARRNLEFYSFNFPIPGIRFIPHRVLPQLVEELNRLKNEFDDHAEEFTKKYHRLRDETLALYADHKEALEDLYPSKETVRQAFSFTWSLFQISLPTRLHRKAVDLRMTEEAKVKAGVIIEMKKVEMVKSFDKWSEQIVKGARAAALELFKTIQEKIRGKEVIHTKSIEALRGFIDQFRSMDFIGDAAMEEALSKARSYLDGAYGTGYGREGFEEAVKGVVAAASKVSDVSSVAGTYRRRFMTE